MTESERLALRIETVLKRRAAHTGKSASLYLPRLDCVAWRARHDRDIARLRALIAAPRA
jgi:hypothetical protein